MKIHHVNGRHLHVGGRLLPKVAHGLHLHSPRYGLNLASWPATPSSTSWGSAPAAQACLTDILGNDQLGDCTEADQYHRQAIRQAAAGGDAFHPTLDQVIATYSRDGGYVPGQPNTDQGCDETVVLGNAVSQGITNGVGVAKSAGYIAIDATNEALVQAVIAMFPGGTSICMSLPQSWIDSAAPGAVWDVPTDPFVPQNGHCFTLGDFMATGRLGIWTWAIDMQLTYDALAAGCTTANGGVLYLEVNAEVLNAASLKAPDGLDWATLIADFDSLGGNVPVPIPPPAPPVPNSAALDLDGVISLLKTSWPTSS